MCSPQSPFTWGAWRLERSECTSVVYADVLSLCHRVQVRTSSVATGVGNVLGNKGGVAVTFNLAGAQVGGSGKVWGVEGLSQGRGVD